jgi:hypothetical protein
MELIDAIGQSMILGLQRVDESLRSLWSNLTAGAERLGLVHVQKIVGEISTSLDERQIRLDWNWSPLAGTIAELLTFAVLGENTRAKDQA